MRRAVAGIVAAGTLAGGTAALAVTNVGDGSRNSVTATAPAIAPAAGRPRPKNDPSWERQVLAGVRQARGQRRLPALRTDRCLTGVARAMARRLADRGARDRTTDWIPDDTSRLMRCASPRLKIHADAAWQSDTRTASAWVRRNFVTDKSHLDRAWRKAGVGAYRDRYGRTHVVVVQIFTTRR